MNVPKLRFKEFTDEWKKVELDKLYEFKNGLNGDKKLYGKGIELINVSDILNNTYITSKVIKGKININEDTLRKNSVEYGDILFQRSSETFLEVGTSSVYLDNKLVTFSGFVIRGKKKKDNINNPLFINYELKSPTLRKKIIICGAGAQHFNIGQDDLKRITIFLPPIKEQNKISDMLELLDKRIELQSKKVETLKLLKKGLSSLIFNSINVISEKKLGNICRIKTGKLDANAMSPNGKYRFYTCAKNYYYTDNYAFDTEALLISGNGAYVGYIHYYKGKFNVYQRTYVLDNFLENIQYIKVYLEEFLSKRISLEKKEGNTPYIVLSTLYDMKIRLTDTKTENKIINLFFYINRKIEQESQRFNKYRELKKALIQNIFI